MRIIEDEIFNDLLGKPGKRETSETQEDEDAPSDIQDDKQSVAGSILRAERASAQTESSFTRTNMATSPVGHINLVTSQVNQTLRRSLGSTGESPEDDGAGETRRLSETVAPTDGVYNSHATPTMTSAGGANCLNDLDGYYQNDISAYQNGEPWLLDHNSNFRKPIDHVQQGYQVFRYNSHAMFGQDAFAAPEFPVLGPQLILSTSSQNTFQGCCSFTSSVEETCVTVSISGRNVSHLIPR